MPTPFFQRLQLPPISVAFEDIVPAASTAARVRQRAVYKDLLHQWPHFLNDAVRDVLVAAAREKFNPDPKFVKYHADGSGDYRLAPGSPALNAATNIGAPPFGRAVDVGAQIASAQLEPLSPQ